MAMFRSRATKWTVLCLSLVGIMIFLLCFVAPHFLPWLPGLIRGFIFQPDQEIPENTDYKNLASFGFKGRNFYLQTEDGVSLGVWHTLPSNLESKDLDTSDNTTESQMYDQLLTNATVFLYLHGSAGSRTSPHRLRLYHLVNQLGYHLVTFDYRGYGDSTGVPLTESNLITDSMTVFLWLKNRTVNGNIFLWGHSLGSGVSAHLAEVVDVDKDTAKGIVLEAAFNNIADVVRADSVVETISSLPWTVECIIKALYKNDLAFESDKHLKNTSLPVLILHAKDDTIVPFSLGEKLYKAVVMSRKNTETVQFIGYDERFKYGHYNITLDPHLNNTIRLFVEKNIT